MGHDQQIRFVRIFAAFFLLLCTYVMWVPFEGSLTKSQATVGAIEQRGAMTSTHFNLSEGGDAVYEKKRWAKYSTLEELSSLKDSVSIWHQKGKVWQVQAKDGHFVISLSSIRRNNYLILLLIYAIFGGMLIFAPKLIAQPRAVENKPVRKRF